MTTRAALLDLAAIEAIVAGNHGDPFGMLGAHNHDGATIIRTFQPGARSVEAIDAADGRALAPLARIDPAGLFEGKVPGGNGRLRYRLRVRWESGAADIEDPYRFPPVLGEVDVHLLAEGNHLRVFEKLGAHPRQMDGVAGVAFAVWAPNARRVSVVGAFNNWDGRRHVMRLRRECGVWEIFIPGLGPGETYKYEIKAMNGDVLPLKADPYAQLQERPPATASVVTAPSAYVWQDAAWMATRAAAQQRDAPISIYEVHLGSWKRKPEEGARYLTYAEMAEDLAPYARDMGFTHIELLPISEYPFDGSWGYQPIGPFAPTSRFGEPDDFRRFVDRCHREGLGVIMDWVPGHFPTDAHGLGMFDGTHLYEHADPRKGKQLDWGTLIYNFGRAEVANFLLSNALYWIERFHIDALRVDAVASMLYLDYSRKPGEWIPNIHGGRENLEAISFLRRLNELVYARGDGAVTMAEESTSWPMVSRPVHLGGLGFGYKWNMGWMHDTLGYMGQDPIHRRYHQQNLTFGLLYAFSENFILPLSHDEVVHGKGSLIGRMPGDRWQKFANLRAYFGLMYTSPGKKLLFMGGEFAQEREWNHDASLDWHLLDDPLHAGMRRLVGDLNRHYRSRLSLHQLDCEPDGFEWIDCSDVDRSILAYLRRARDRDDCTIVVCNFTPVPRYDYRIGAPIGGEYVEILNTDAADYGGGNIGNSGRVWAESVPWHGQPHSLSLTLPPLSTIMLAPARGGDR